MSHALNVSDIHLFNLLKNKLGEKEAEQFVGLVKDKINHTMEAKNQTISKDIISLHNEVAMFRDEIYKNFATKEDIAKLQIFVARIESKLLLWAFVFWATQLAAIFAFLKLFMK